MTAELVTWDDNVQDWADDETPDNPWIRRPDGFQPTRARPIPGMQCRGTTKNGPRAGQRCGRTAIYGGTVCIMHGGKAVQVRKKAAAIVQLARMQLCDDVTLAVDVIEELMRNAVSEPVRLKAATEVLDRVGIRGGTELDIGVTMQNNPSELLRDRITSLKKRTIEAESTEVSVTVTQDTQPEESPDV